MQAPTTDIGTCDYFPLAGKDFRSTAGKYIDNKAEGEVPSTACLGVYHSMSSWRLASIFELLRLNTQIDGLWQLCDGSDRPHEIRYHLYGKSYHHFIRCIRSSRK